jgi:hypothetical protein
LEQARNERHGVADDVFKKQRPLGLTHQRGDIAQIDGLGDLQQFIVFSQNINVISKTRSHDSLQKRFDFSFSDNDTAPKPCPIHDGSLNKAVLLEE